jgi:glucosamine--fructose-6-phosphate aminotransferase (isomerizing)
MCGIVGYIGSKSAVGVLENGLSKLEYRGYDSAGVAVMNGSGIKLRRAVGKLDVLKKSLHDEPIEGHLGIAHTRWATHGIPNETNSHPHRDMTETVFVCHNGIIENYGELRQELQAKGITFRSQTDSEVLPNLIKLAYDALEKEIEYSISQTPDEANDGASEDQTSKTEAHNNARLAEAVRLSCARIRGTYAIAVMHQDLPETLVGARWKSPLVVGLGEHENILASDIPAILQITRRVILLDDGEMAVLHRDSVEVFDMDDGKARHKAAALIDWDEAQAEKGDFPNFMLKEIHEQPDVINRLLSRYTNPERTHVKLEGINVSDDVLRGVRRIFIQACGTSWHAGLIGKYLLERLPMIAVDIDTSSEFRYRQAVLAPDTLVIAISQSGETEDTKAGIEEAKSRGLRVLSIVNAPGSAITRMSDGVIYTNAGPEISVASTKAYTAQICAMYLLSLYLGDLHGLIDGERMKRRLAKLGETANLMQQMLAPDSPLQTQVRAAADVIRYSEHALFIGRGFGYPSALEGALKLKEISYIHAEGYPAGELKHGPLALIDQKRGTPIVAIATSGVVYEKMISNMNEVKARGGRVVAVVGANNPDLRDGQLWHNQEVLADCAIPVPELTESFAPFMQALSLQLLAYHVAILRGEDVDKPRNLAKSVTVE